MADNNRFGIRNNLESFRRALEQHRQASLRVMRALQGRTQFNPNAAPSGPRNARRRRRRRRDVDYVYNPDDFREPDWDADPEGLNYESASEDPGPVLKRRRR